jgi:hypothetical protein
LPVEDAGMNSSRLVFAIVAVCCLLRSEPLFAEDFASPFGPTQQFSADMIITTKDGATMTQKIYIDTGKMRTEMSMQGIQMVSIVRPDLKKIYQVMVTQKMVMEMPYDAEKIKKQIPAISASDGKFEALGPDTVDGVDCTKSKMTSGKENKVFFFWVDADTKAPVKMMAEDNSMTMLWKNYKAGPQPAALFEPPSGYKIMTMPVMPGGAGQ